MTLPFRLGESSGDVPEVGVPPTQHLPVVARVRALFISDVHLGTAASQANRLLSFLQCYQADVIYLVGDIVDGWRLLRGQSWPPSHVAVMAELMARAQTGIRVVYIPGNHDEYLRSFSGATVGGVEIVDRVIHETESGQRYLVVHGDQFDRVMQRMRWATFIGNLAYRASFVVNNIATTRMPIWRYCRTALAWAKQTIRVLVNTISRFEELLMTEARLVGVDGVICGHTHDPADRDLAGLHYLNTGDWVESCTGVIEHLDGRLCMVRCSDHAAVAQACTQLTDPAVRPAEEGVAIAA
jgi:UDP-2,3-diacylglucosamine pyrophosphatase LpxH